MAQTLELTVNGATRRVEVAEDAPLLWVLRDALGLKAARFGCGHERCGACMVLIDGEPAYSCTLPANTLAGRAIVTAEGLGSAEAPHPVQAALLAEQAGQCGWCLSGIEIAAAALLARNPAPSRAEIAGALDPHLCRCGIHGRVVRAVERAASAMREEAA